MELQEIAALVDEYDEARNHRLEVDKQAARLKREETILHDRILAVLFDNDMHYAAGKYKRVKLNTTIKPKAEDWEAIYNYILVYGATEIVQKRLHEGAIKDRVDEGEIIPGIAFVEVNKLSIGKI